MKNDIKYVIFLLAVLLTACQENVQQPVAKLEVSATEVDVNQMIDFNFTGTADQVVIFTGDKGHVYEQKNHQNIGVVLPKKHTSHSYSVPGIYHVVIVASCYGERAANLSQDTCGVYVHVKDNNAAIRSIYTLAYNDEIHAQECNGNWLLPMPKEVWVDVKFIKVKANSMLLNIKLFSDSTHLNINGEPYDRTVKYNFTKPLSLTAKAYDGAEINQKLYPVYRPEFASFSVNVGEATITKDCFTYIQHVDIVVPKGTDLSKIKPSFTLYEGQKAEVNGKQVQSGDEVDLSQPALFTLTNTQTFDGKDYIVTTTVPVTAVMEP